MANISVEARLGGLPYARFLLVYLDETGQVRLQSSGPIVDSGHEILSMKVIDAFLRVLHMAGETCFSNYNVEPSLPISRSQAGTPMVTNLPHSLKVGMSLGSDWPVEKPALKATASQAAAWSVYTQPRPYFATETPIYKGQEACKEWTKSAGNKKVMISVKDQDLLALYYEKAFENIQQTNCRILAKAYVKLVEPQKQVNYPYNGRKLIAGTRSQLDPNETKPPWWPSGVSHREPDHLPKVERIRLLVHILRELRISHGISVAQLKEADQQARHQILPLERLHILDELYHVRQKEELFLDGKIDRQAMVWISTTNLPQAAETVRYTRNTGNGNPTQPITPRDIQISNTSGNLSNSVWSYHTLQSPIESKQITRQQPSPGSSLSNSNRYLKRRYDFVDIRSTTTSSTVPAYCSFPLSTIGQLPSVDDYGPVYQIQSPIVLNTRRSTGGMINPPPALEYGAIGCGIKQDREETEKWWDLGIYSSDQSCLPCRGQRDHFSNPNHMTS